MRRYSYLTKMIVFGCILCTLPVLFFGFISYIQSSSEIQKQVNRSQMQLLTQMNANVEQTLQTMNHGLNQLVNSTVMAKVMNEPFRDNNFMLYRDLRKEISNTQTPKVEDIVLVNLRQNWLIKNSGFYQFDQYIHYNQIKNQLLLPGSTSWVMNPSLWFYSEEKANSAECAYTISLVKRLPNQVLDQFGLAYANLPVCRIADILNYTPRESENVMILDDQDRVLYHTDSGLIGQYVRNTGVLRTSSELTDASGQFQRDVNNKAVTVSYLRSPFNNWIYLTVISIDSLTQEAKKTRAYVIYTCLIILTVFLTIAWFGSRQMYSPIQRLLLQTGGKENRNDSRRMSEFDIISNRMHDLSESKSLLEQEAGRHLQQARALFLIKMFQGAMRRKDLLEKLEQFAFRKKMEEWPRMSVIVLQIDTLEQTRYGKDDLELLLFAINNIVEELVPSETRLPPVFIEQTQVVLFGSQNSEEEFNRYLYSITESIRATVLEVLGLSISIGISLPFDDPKQASVAYREGQEALKQRIHLGGGVVIQYASINFGKHHLHLDYPKLTENELVDAILLAEETKARALLKQFMQIVSKYEMTPQEYQVPMFRLLNKLLEVMQEFGVPLSQLHPKGGSLYEELHPLQMASEIEDWFWMRLVAPLLQIFENRQNSQYQNISEQVVTMIQQHYDTDLTIEKCAAELHYNANYLSGVFRRETNSTFSDYLSAYRFNMAKKWLTTTDMTIKDIAERLQYMNSQNFIRSFRKQEGMTPGQYRETYLKGNRD